MTEPYSRRDWIKTVGAVSAGALVPLDTSLGAPTASPRVATAPLAVREVYAPGDIVELYSTSDVFTPPRGRSFMKFSFDFPEPAVVFGDHRFSFLLFTEENTYALDRSFMRVTGNDDALELTCTGLAWAGGQEKAPGKVSVKFTCTGRTIEWDIVAEMQRPIKTVTTVIRDVPRGQVSLGGAPPADTRDGDVLGGYTFGAGDLHGAETLAEHDDNRRSCTLIAKPIAMKVASTEDKPALIKGSGTPITGSKPTAMPTLMKIWKMSPPTIAMITSIPVRSRARRASVIKRVSKSAYEASSARQPIKPVVSAVTAKIKSECGSGKNFRLLCEYSGSREPIKPPEPTVTIDCHV